MGALGFVVIITVAVVHDDRVLLFKRYAGGGLVALAKIICWRSWSHRGNRYRLCGEVITVEIVGFARVHRTIDSLLHSQRVGG